MPTKKSTHKRGCKCVICAHKRRKPAKKTAARKRNGITPGKLNKWVKASAVRVRKIAGQFVVDLR